MPCFGTLWSGKLHATDDLEDYFFFFLSAFLGLLLDFVFFGESFFLLFLSAFFDFVFFDFLSDFVSFFDFFFGFGDAFTFFVCFGSGFDFLAGFGAGAAGAGLAAAIFAAAAMVFFALIGPNPGMAQSASTSAAAMS